MSLRCNRAGVTRSRLRYDAPDESAGSTAPAAETNADAATTVTEDRSYYILPPGNYGGLPKTDESTDQLALYDGLTPLRGDVTDGDIERLFLPQDFAPIGATTEEPTGRDGHHDRLRRVRDSLTSPARPARTWPSAPDGSPLGTAGCSSTLGRWPSSRGGRRRTGSRRVLSGHQRADIHTERS